MGFHGMESLLSELNVLDLLLFYVSYGKMKAAEINLPSFILSQYFDYLLEKREREKINEQLK